MYAIRSYYADLVYGNEEQGLMPYQERIERGSVAIQTLREMKKAKESGDQATYNAMKEKFDDPQWREDYYSHFGYGYYRGADMNELILV